MMRNSSVDRVSAQAWESEFVPPLELGDSTRAAWGLPWERQIEAAMAWQEAGGNDDGSAEQWSGAFGEEAGPPSMRTIMRMNTLTVALRERLLQIQTEAANVAIAEMRERQLSRAEGEGAAAPPLPQLGEENARRLRELTRAWFDVVGVAQLRMAQLTGATRPMPFGERRRQAVTIDFPDRRMAM